MNFPVRVVFILLAFFLIQLRICSHGEGRPGPNSGSIRMSGAFHPELVLVNDRKFIVDLLDMNMQNATVQNSVFEAAVKIGDWERISS